ncbi:MAG: dihydropteroate synthase [Treponema sp.]|jgi:dihydropteroate synthase|nr:dihydropteroate synthase [Treponema sp.]
MILPLNLPSGVRLAFSPPQVMAIINCTPDSFYGPSRASSPEAAADRALAAQEEGAGVVDFGAESTRPGAEYIDAEEEIRRLIPALRLFRRRSTLPVSVDTRKAVVARAALDEGADMINDVSTLADPGMAALCAERKAAVVITHSPPRTTPKTMGKAAGTYADAAGEVKAFLLAAADRARAEGVARERIILDPGIGFGKSAADNLLLINRLAEIGGGDYPVLVGLSRKSFIGEITGRPPEGRLPGTIAANAAALLGGAAVLRVHDTAAAVDLIRVFGALGKKG